MPTKYQVKIRLNPIDAEEFRRLNATADDPVDLSNSIETSSSATYHFLEYALHLTKKHLAALGTTLKALIPGLKHEIVFEIDDEVGEVKFRANNFTDPEEIIRIQSAFFADRARFARQIKGQANAKKSRSRANKTKSRKSQTKHQGATTHPRT